MNTISAMAFCGYRLL